MAIPSPNYSSRSGTRVTTIVLHTAEGALTYQSLGNYFANPNADVSSHTGIDDTPGVVGEYVRRDGKAWTASNANPYSVQAELCAFASWDEAEWNRHPTMLANTAAWIAEEAAAFGIPLDLLDASGAQNPSQMGVCQHNDLGSMGGGHWDCGPSFPIAHVLDLARGGSSIPKPPQEEHDMAAPATCIDSEGRSWLFFRNSETEECMARVGGDRPFSLGGKVTDAITAVPGERGQMDVYAYVPEPKGEVWGIHNSGSLDGWNDGGGWYRLG